MSTQAEMKSQLQQLEAQKRKLEDEILKSSQGFKMSLWGIGIGVILLPLYWSGIPVILIAGIAAIYYSVKRTTCEDKLGNLETEIHKLEISMA
jgi:hypothetical protein